MNTIPIIFNERQFKRTILGGNVCSPNIKIPLTVILLNRGGTHFRSQQLETLLSEGFARIICVENSAQSYVIEEYAQNYPAVKFIIPQEKITSGEMINAAIGESLTEFALVLWDDIKITKNMVTKNSYDKIIKDNIFCTAPYLQSNSFMYLPVRMVPSVEKYSLIISPETILSSFSDTAYPFDFIGIYNCNKFKQLGGFDYTLTNPYWQNLDFSLRGWLWGEKIQISPMLKFMYEEEIPLEDSTVDYMQLRFYLKNTAPVFTNDHAYIPISRVFNYIRSASKNLFSSIKDFIDARKWVEKNRYRFKMDMPYLVDNWERCRSQK